MNQPSTLVATAALLFVAGYGLATAHAHAGMANTLLVTPEQESSGKTTQSKQTPEQAEALKARQAKAMKENEIITQVNLAMQEKKWGDAATGFKQLIELEPNRYHYYAGLGDAQFNLGEYENAIHTYDKGVQVAQSSTGPKEDPARTKVSLGQMLTNEGNCYLKLRKTDQAVAAYEKAAAIDPRPGTAYFNLCATHYNQGQMEAASAACEKAIAADPTKADAYFIRGSVLYASGSLDKQNKFIVPPGTVEALNKYLELAPDGGHVADVKAMLEALGEPIKATHSETKKK